MLIQWVGWKQIERTEFNGCVDELSAGIPVDLPSVPEILDRLTESRNLVGLSHPIPTNVDPTAEGGIVAEELGMQANDA
ncbi:MAG: hypothetical protein Udaeo2_25590 [Candidatus Udaeobacter sp.]|nr:MAG: hypothetical protein Udaeo2_25590 [Candidatus Udaeobacter sp.]